MLFGTSHQMKDNEILRCLHSLKNDTSTQTTITMNIDLISLTDKHLYFWYLAENDIQVKFIFNTSNLMIDKKLLFFSFFYSLYIHSIFKKYLLLKLQKIKFVID
jgi:hypothetical protein